jgi:hypothetical protein
MLIMCAFSGLLLQYLLCQTFLKLNVMKNHYYLPLEVKNSKSLFYSFTSYLALFALLLFNATSASAQSYCSAVALNTSHMGIGKVQFSNVNNTSSGTSATYTNYSTSQVANTVNGQPYTLTINGTGSYQQLVNAYVDWNDDGDFNDSGEAYDLGSMTGSGATSTSILVPATAVTGTFLRMRIVAGYNSWYSAPVLGYSDCNSSNSGYTSNDVVYFGEVEDYGIMSSPPASCSGTPSAGVVSLVTSGFCIGSGNAQTVSATATYDNTPGFDHIWQVRQNGGSFTDIPGATNPASLSYTLPATTTLTTTSSFQFRLKSYCVIGGTSYSTAQTLGFGDCYNAPNTGNISIDACAGTIYDAGGANSNYNNSSSGSITIYPTTPGVPPRPPQ